MNENLAVVLTIIFGTTIIGFFVYLLIETIRETKELEQKKPHQ